MGCCNDQGPGPGRPLPQFEHLPDQTFCCMARMGYTLARSAEALYAHGEHIDWYSLDEDSQAAWARRAKAVLAKTFIPQSKFDLSFEDILRTMTTVV